MLLFSYRKVLIASNLKLHALLPFTRWGCANCRRYSTHVGSARSKGVLSFRQQRDSTGTKPRGTLDSLQPSPSFRKQECDVQNPDDSLLSPCLSSVVGSWPHVLTWKQQSRMRQSSVPCLPVDSGVSSHWGMKFCPLLKKMGWQESGPNFPRADVKGSWTFSHPSSAMR